MGSVFLFQFCFSRADLGGKAREDLDVGIDVLDSFDLKKFGTKHICCHRDPYSSVIDTSELRENAERN